MTQLDGARSADPVLAEAFAQLCDVLWQERDLLTTLHFRLEAQLLLLRSNATQWIKLADEDVRAAVQLVKECEVARAVEAHTVSTALALPSDATLQELVVASPEPWSSMLSDHHRALADIADRARDSISRTRHVVRPGSALSAVGGESEAGQR